MFFRSLSSHGLTQGTLTPNTSISNIPKSSETRKRPFDRTMSSARRLDNLHDSSRSWDENERREVVELSDIDSDIKTFPRRLDNLDRSKGDIVYPQLPPPPSQPANPSSAAIPWSSSPQEHFVKPQSTLKDPSDTDSRPSKRRTLPWLDKAGNDKTLYTPLPSNKPNGPSYPWNKSASSMKREQNELRKRSRQKAQQLNGQQTLKSASKDVPRMALSDEQKNILDAVVDKGKCVFFTGAAGTGKSVLMRSVISRLRDLYKREPDRVAVTASTGLAACNIEGMTLHSFAGIGLGKDPAPELIKRIKRNGALKQRWMRTKVLIIDEISMVDGDLFDKLETIARTIRGTGKPFGGIQLVVTGDFFQLPPVPDKNSVAKFAFDAVSWNTSIEHTILLSHVFRQKDPTFANMLNEMRLGRLTPASISTFKSLSRPLAFKDAIDATELFPTRAEVDRANQTRMTNLSGSEMVFTAMDSGSQDPIIRKKTLSNSLAPEVLIMKKGAQVMLIKNLDAGLVNGSIGRVQCFMNEHDFSIYHGNEEMYLQSYEPEDVGDTEQNAINAKARAAINAARLKTNAPPARVWPMVRFSMPDGTSRDLLCQPEEFKTEAPGGEILAKRIQVPLILAWALSIHKAQGQTLERVKVDLRKIFERGQSYVALSRATSQSGLQVIGFEPRKVAFNFHLARTII